jgi:hypothetical protein
MVSGDILAGIADKVKPFLQESKNAAKIGKVVVGTVAGDIHDIAKDIVVFMLDVNGFEVIDLGVDVPAEKFVEAVQEHHAKMVGLSGPDRVAENGYLEPDIPESLLPMSGAEVILTWIPDAHVVKTLTTVSYFVIGDPSTADGPVTVPVAANDKAVRTRIIEILKEIGLDAIDVGVLRMAREIEGMTRLYMIPIQRRELDCTWEFYFRRVSGWVGTDLDDFFPKLDD